MYGRKWILLILASNFSKAKIYKSVLNFTLTLQSDSYFYKTTSLSSTIKISNETLEQKKESSIETPFFSITASET